MMQSQTHMGNWTLRLQGREFLMSMRMQVLCWLIWYKSTGQWPLIRVTVPC